MSKNDPKVSIIIPVYNGADYMKYAIDSALSQTYKNIEIIVVNDGSKDNGKTRKIAESYKNKIKYYEKENGGVATALNLAIKKMTGDYFSWLSHDDEYYPKKVEEEVKALKNTTKTIAMSDFCTIDEHGILMNNVTFEHKAVENSSYFPLFEGKLNGITLLIPKEVFDTCGDFDINLKCTQDYDLWYRMLNAGYKFKHVPKVLAKSRQHRNQTTYLSPNTKREGNELWINLIDSLPKKEKEKLYGSEYDFYLCMLEKMHFAGYDQAYKHLKKLLNKKYPSKIFKTTFRILNIKYRHNIDTIVGIIKRTCKRSFKENIEVINRKVFKRCKK